MIRTLKFDDNLEKYVLLIKNETEIKAQVDGIDKVVGIQKQTMEQIWDKDQINLITKQMEEQEKDVKTKIEGFEAQLKQLGKMTDREKQTIQVFAKNLQKAQKLQQIEKIEGDKKQHEEALVKILKDKKELVDAIK